MFNEQNSLSFLDWYKQGMSYYDFLDKIKTTTNPIYERYKDTFDKDLFKGNKALKDLFFVSDLWGEKHGMPLWQFWFDEYIQGLADYIKKEYNNPRVLEVGAGDGSLSYLLEQKGVDVVATTDNKSWCLLGKMRYLKKVEKLDYNLSIKKYRPDVILMSWMPYGHDWTACFRRFESTKGYILIGEGEGGCCGNDKTFKPPKKWDFIDKPFDFDKFNLCRADCLINEEIGWLKHSVTIDVRRKNA